MIPTVAAAQLALQPYLLWIKLAVYALIVAAIFGAGAKVGASLTATRYEAREAKQAREYQSAVKAARDQEKASYAQRDAKSEAMQRDLVALRTERDRLRALPARVVRVYVPAAAPRGVPADGRPAPGSDGTAAAPAEPAATLGPDIGRSLYDLADDGDIREAELRVKLRTCVDGWAAAAREDR